ncbi:autotransporter adhesin BpaC-like [Lytechinus pictus]|uniref:autotransporter adhesin BpaC-like n=1 Tax=Lytechinus pictus TaxID=7653 RepID=UPI00240D1DDE|nr:autotransporter adhesin BpaC-like [Lytechinus pictus]XP_054755824.1 autotransporter adhesin BpaC-like [Lytechinus pictus]
MASTGKMFGLFCLLFVFCIMAEARQGLNVPQKQTMGDTTPTTQMNTTTTDDDDSVSSESTESSEDDMDNDADEDIAAAATGNNAAATGNNAAATGNNAAAAPAGAPVSVGSGNQVAGNMLPNTRARGHNGVFGRESAASGQTVAIALAAVGVVAVVIAGAVFAIRKHRRDNFA